MRFTFTNLCYKQINIILLNQSWILIVVSTLVTVLVLKILSKKYSWNQRFPTEGVRNGENLALFVMGNIVSQGIFFLCNSTRQFKRNVTQTNCCTIISLFILPGQHYFPDRLTVRVAAGAWACGAFFLVQIYCCTLTSHLMALNQKPLVNSFFEVADKPGVTLTLDRGYAVDVLLQVGYCDPRV